MEYVRLELDPEGLICTKVKTLDPMVESSEREIDSEESPKQGHEGQVETVQID